MIKTLDLCQQVPVYDGTLDILKGISMEIKPGEAVAIVGASGSGKSTLLGLMAGLDLPSSGQVYLNQHHITAMDEEQRAKVRGECVSFVFQNFQLLNSLNAVENIMLPLEVRGDTGARRKAIQYLERVGLAARAHHYPNQLSGGEQQRVALARAFACEAPVMFADEPTGNLDTATGEHIAELLFAMHAEAGVTLVIVTHDATLASRCQRHFEMCAGTIRETASQ